MKTSLDKIKSIVAYIIDSQSYPDIMFSGTSIGAVLVDEELIHYKITKFHSNNRTIEILVNNNLFYKPLQKRRNKCKFCNKKECNMVLNCCNKSCHFTCVKNNRYRCDCNQYMDHIKSKLDIHNVINQDTCVVCLDEDCTTRTTCGHTICNTCACEIYFRRGRASLCPICRQPLLKVITDELNLSIDVGRIIPRTIKVRIMFYDK